MTALVRIVRTYPLAIVFALALAFRVSVALWLPQEVIWPDGSRYERVALNIINGKGFGTLMENRQSVPTQPLLIAAVYSVFERSYLALRVFFAVIGAASCVLGSMLARKLFGSRAGVIAGLMLAAYPYLVYLSALFEYPQTLFIFVMALFFWLYYRFLETGHKGLLFLAALNLGIGVLSVPTTLIFAAAFGILLSTRNVRETLVRLAICAVAAALTVGAWTARNYVAYDRPILVNAAGGGAFWLGNNETYWQHGKAGVVPPCGPGYESTRYCRETESLRMDLERRQLGDVESVLEEERISWQYGSAFVREDPGRFLLLTTWKFVDLWRPVPDAVHDADEHGGEWRDAVAASTYIPVLLLAIAGIVATWEQRRLLLPIYVYVVTFVAPYAIFFPTTRYRMPIDFLLILFAAAALANIRRQHT